MADPEMGFRGGQLIHFIVFFMQQSSYYNCLLYEMLSFGRGHGPLASLKSATGDKEIAVLPGRISFVAEWLCL